jgi:hypothetical protein
MMRNTFLKAFALHCINFVVNDVRGVVEVKVQHRSEMWSNTKEREI